MVKRVLKRVMFIYWLLLFISVSYAGAQSIPLNDPSYPLIPIKNNPHSSQETFLIMQDAIMDLPLGIVPSYKAIENKRTLTNKERVNAMNKAREAYTNYTCVRQDQYLPELDKEADQWFEQARALEKEARDRNLTEGDKERIFGLYTNAANKKHWKAMHNLALLYQEGKGTPRSYSKAIDLFEAMMAMNIPIGYYDIFRALNTGMGVHYDDEAATQYLYKAASLGNPEAQHYLGTLFTNTRGHTELGIKFLKCALEQDYWRSGYELGATYKTIVENYPKAAFYYRAAGALGDAQSLYSFRSILTDSEYGYNLDNESPLINLIRDYGKLSDRNPDLRFPDLIEKAPIPDHPYMGQGEDIPDSQNHNVLKRMMVGKIQGKNWREIPSIPNGKYPELKEMEAEHPWLKEY